MTIQDLGSIGELLAAIATIVTLLYLAVQIRANTRATRFQARQAAAILAQGPDLAITTNDEVADIFRRGLVDFSDLSPTEQIRFTFLLSEMLSSKLTVFDSEQLGLDGTSVTLQSMGFLRSPGARQWWEAYGDQFPPEFRSHIEEEYDLKLRHGSTTQPAAQQSAAADSA